MKIKHALISLASLALAVTSQAGVLTYFWEENGSNVIVTLSGTLDVAGWSTDGNASGSAAAYFGNEDGPDQIIMVRSPSTGGRTYNTGAGLTLSPWGAGAPTGASLIGAYQSGSFAGLITISNIGGSPGMSAYVETASVEGGSYTVDAVYRFSNSTLGGMFGDGLSAWSTGAQIATIGSNEVRFTTQAIPEPSAAVLLVGGAAVLALWRRRRK